MKGRDEKESLGVVLLDGITFHKVVPSPTLSVLVLVSHAGSFGDYGTDSIRADFMSFAEKGELQGKSESILFAQIVVEPFINEDGSSSKSLSATEVIARDVFSLGKDFKHPRLFLFKPDSKSPIAYSQKGAFNNIALTRWLSKQSDFYLDTPGTIHAYDKLVPDFFIAMSEGSGIDQILEQAEALVPKVELKDKDNCQYYLKVMKTILAKGVGFVKSEIKRLEDIVSSENLSNSKKIVMQRRINILHVFDRDQVHDEL